MISELRMAPADENRSYLDAREADLTEAIAKACARIAGINAAIQQMEAALTEVRTARLAEKRGTS
jgi:prefoldin subunit 5